MDHAEEPPKEGGVGTGAPHPKFVIGCSDEDFEDTLEENEVLHVVPPDGGWGWVVVGASFACNAVVDGIIFTSGMLLPKFREEFGASNSEVAWISSLLGGFYLLVGPFVSALANAFGFRVVCIIGAIIASLACVLSYFATSVYFLYGSFGILGGVGFGLIYVPAVIATGFYFEKRRALATGIAVCGSGIGTFVMSPLNAFLLTSLGDRWNFIFLIYAGIILSCAFFGLAFRPLSASTGKHYKEPEDDGLDVNGTPLLMRIKRARDEELAQCPSAISMTSAFSRSPSVSPSVALDENQQNSYFNMNGDLKPQVARALLERHGGGSTKRFSYPGLSAPTPEPILEEDAETNDAEETNEELKKSETGSESGSLRPLNNSAPKFVPEPDKGKDGPEKPLLDNNKNETTPIRAMSLAPNSTAYNNTAVANGDSVHRGARDSPLGARDSPCRARDSPLTVQDNGKCLRNMSAPTLLDNRRRPSRIALRTEVSRPFYRNDIFYSGSLARLPQYQSSDSISHYHISVTNLPPMDVLAEDEARGPCGSFATSFKHVLLRIFDFSLLSSITFIFLSVSGFLALMSLFVPFNFLPSYALEVGIDPGDISFLMSLIGICNTVGRIIAGWVSDHPRVDALFVNNLALIIGGGATVFLPFLSDLSFLYCYAVVFGLCVAAFASLRSILLVELLGLEKLTNAFGLLLLFQGFAATFGSPIAGAFVDMTQQYNLSFYVFGSIFALSGVLCIPLRWIKRWEDDRTDKKLRKEKYGV